MSSIQDFRRKNGIELLMVSDETLKVGQKAKYGPLIKRGLEIQPIYITDRLQFESEDELKYEELFNNIAKAEKKKAEIPNYTLSSTFDFRTALDIASLNIDLSNELNLSKIESFSYQGVKARVIEINVGTPLIKKLVSIKGGDKKWWRQIDGLNFVEKLYYADKVVITSERNYSDTIVAKLQHLNLDVDVKVSGSNASKITFEGAPEVPFAAKIEVIRDWAK